MAQDKGLLIYYDWKVPLETLPGDDFKALVLAMMDYSKDGTPPPEFEGMAKMAAAFIFPAISRAKEAAEAGRRGGLKSKENREKKSLLPNGTAERGTQGGTKGTAEGTATTIQIRYDTDTDTDTYTDTDTIDDSGGAARSDPSSITHAQEETVFERYRKLCPSLNAVQKMTPKRREAVRELLTQYTVEEITEGFRKAEATPYLSGRDSGRPADFDWLIQPDNFTKLLEGKYDERHDPTSKYEVVMPF